MSIGISAAVPAVQGGIGRMPLFRKGPEPYRHAQSHSKVCLNRIQDLHPGHGRKSVGSAISHIFLPQTLHFILGVYSLMPPSDIMTASLDAMFPHLQWKSGRYQLHSASGCSSSILFGFGPYFPPRASALVAGFRGLLRKPGPYVTLFLNPHMSQMNSTSSPMCDEEASGYNNERMLRMLPPSPRDAPHAQCPIVECS